MLARIAHDLYWLGRHLVRAEHTARMLDGLFHADLQGRPDDPASVTLSWESLLVIMGAGETDGPARRDDVVRLLTTDIDNPVSIVSCVTGAREGARTLRETISAEMWESVNTFDLLLSRRDLPAGLRAGPYSIYSMVKERCALFWGLTGRTMQKDDARAFLQAGGRIEAADMVLRMLRVALPPVPEAESEDAPEAPRRDGNALALLRAVGGFQAFMRSAAAPPNAGPVARFMLYEREFPDSVAASVASLDATLERVEPVVQDSPPVLRVRRMSADLDFRARVAPGPEAVIPALRPIQQELERLDVEIHERYFHPSTRRPDRHRMRYLLRYHAEYRYSGPVFDQHNVLRVTPATTPLQRVRGFRVVVEPSARTRTYSDYFGTEVIEFNVPGEHERLAITAEGEVSTEEPAAPPDGGWDLTRAEAYTSRGGEFLLHTDDEPGNGGLAELHDAITADTPRATLEALCRVIPDRFEYRKGATFVGSTVDDLLVGGAGVCQDFVHLSLILLRRAGLATRYVSGYLFAGPPAAGQLPRGLGARAPSCQPTAGGTPSRSTPTRGSRRSCRARRASRRPGSAPIRPTASSPEPST